jgi:hypothetical protein
MMETDEGPSLPERSVLQENVVGSARAHRPGSSLKSCMSRTRKLREIGRLCGQLAAEAPSFLEEKSKFS